MIYQTGVADKDDNKVSNSSDSDSNEIIKVDDSSSPALPPARGILNDFDLAEVLNLDDNAGISSTSTPHHHITGTIPFMAVDLLEPSRPRNTLDLSNIHHYRCDFESFYYLLIWASTLYNLKAGRQVSPKETSLVYRWSKGDEIYAYHAKVSLHSRDFEKYAADIRPEWADIWNKWVRPLSKVFRHGFIALDDARDENIEDFDYATCGGHLTFEKFMFAIGETPRGYTKQKQTS